MPNNITPPCDPIDETSGGKALVVVDQENCFKQLIPPDDMEGAGLACQISPNKVELRDGSEKYPIPIPHLQTQVGGSISHLVFMDGGNLKSFQPDVQNAIEHKLIFQAGQFRFVPDCLPGIACNDLCPITSCDDFDYVLGLRATTITYGEEEIPVLKLVKVPKSLLSLCVPEEPTE